MVELTREQYYCLIGLVVVLACVGAFVYYRSRKRSEEDEKREMMVWAGIASVVVLIFLGYFFYYYVLTEKDSSVGRYFRRAMAVEDDNGPVSLYVGGTDPAGNRRAVGISYPEVPGAKYAFDYLFWLLDKGLHGVTVLLLLFYGFNYVRREYLAGTWFGESQEPRLVCGCDPGGRAGGGGGCGVQTVGWSWYMSVDKLWFAVMALHLRMFVVALIEAARRPSMRAKRLTSRGYQ